MSEEGEMSVVEIISTGKQTESLDYFLLGVAAEFNVIPVEKQSEYVSLWREKLGIFCTEKKNLITLVSHPENWSKIQIDETVKATIAEKLTNREEIKLKPKCSDAWLKMLQQISYAKLFNGFLFVLEKDAQWLDFTYGPLLVRNSYVELFHQIESKRQNNKGVIVSGNPGIGKSYFLFYCLYRYYHEQKRTVVYHDIQTAFMWKIEDNTILSFDLADISNLRPNSIYLVNSGNPIQEPNPMIAFNEKISFTILSASPRKTHYKVFQQKPGIFTLYMPTWTNEELNQLNNYYKLPGDTLLDYIHLFNGVPRYIFNGGRDKWLRTIDDAIYSCTSTELLKYIGSQNIDPEVSHKIIKIIPTNDFTSYHIEFSSEYVSEKLPKQLAKRERDGVVTLVKQSLVDIPDAQALRGYLFQPLAHEKLSYGGIFTTNVEAFHLPNLPITETTATWNEFANGSYSIPKQTYVKPLKKNFDLVDSLCWLDDKTLVGFQLTVGTSHTFNMNKADKLLDACKAGEFRVYFVLPTDKFTNFIVPLSSQDGLVKCFKLKLDDYDIH